MYMNKWTQKQFEQLLRDCYQKQGWAIPQTVVRYETELFARYVNRVPWQPEPSYAERYLQIRTVEDAQDLGDCCFFTRAVFPELGERRGIKSSYYVDLGQSCYSRVQTQWTDPAIDLMCKHFEFLAEAALTAIRYSDEFRSMWD